MNEFQQHESDEERLTCKQIGDEVGRQTEENNEDVRNGQVDDEAVRDILKPRISDHHAYDHDVANDTHDKHQAVGTGKQDGCYQRLFEDREEGDILRHEVVFQFFA